MLMDVDRDLVMPWRSGKWQKSMALLFEFTTITLPRQALPGTDTQQNSFLARNHMACARPRNMRKYDDTYGDILS